MAVKCVMKCLSKTSADYEGAPVQVALEPRYTDDAGNRINEEFARYTPCGRLDLTIDNPPAAEQFEEGAYYEVLLTKRS